VYLNTHLFVFTKVSLLADPLKLAQEKCCCGGAFTGANGRRPSPEKEGKASIQAPLG
jgi:hypothetical protein